MSHHAYRPHRDIAIAGILFAAILIILTMLAGCGEAQPRLGSAQAAAVATQARAQVVDADATKARLEAAQAKAAASAADKRAADLAEQAERSKIGNDIAAAKAAAVAAVEANRQADMADAVAAAYSAEADRLAKASKEATMAGEAEHAKEVQAQQQASRVDRAWLIGMLMVVAGGIAGGLVAFIAKKIALGTEIAGVVAGTGLVILILGPVTQLLSELLPWAAAVAGLYAVTRWAWHHRRDLGADNALKTEVVNGLTNLEADAAAALHKAEARAVAEWHAIFGKKPAVTTPPVVQQPKA
ncbi:MAG: hypothetical protein KGN77_05195 [Xanthomonadaceae bacterium]|nr:hypothetical protein [Xanthomonadaceae bacterium]